MVAGGNNDGEVLHEKTEKPGLGMTTPPDVVVA
jgi:hypothetical protein